MNKAERLFQLITLLQARRTAITAQQLAQALQVSERTIYRDIQSLSISGIPVEGEAGVGYRLRKGFDIPPLMFTHDEIEALVLGARMVCAWTDKRMAAAAHHAMQKITSVLPEQLKHIPDDQQLIVPDFHIESKAAGNLETIRTAIREQSTLLLSYCSLNNEQTKREIRPLGLFYWGQIWTLAAWCLLRDDFRTFRLDRMIDLESKNKFTHEKGKTLEDYLTRVCEHD